MPVEITGTYPPRSGWSGDEFAECLYHRRGVPRCGGASGELEWIARQIEGARNFPELEATAVEELPRWALRRTILRSVTVKP